MSYPLGKAALQYVAGFSVFKWFTSEIPRLATELIKAYKFRNELRGGGVLSVGGSVTASVLQINMTALDVILHGRHKAQLAAQTNLDLFTTSGAAAQAIYTNGATAAAIALSGTQKAQVAVIACNTDGAGGVEDADNGAGTKLLAVVNGTASTYHTETTMPTSVEIQAALEASTGVHAGVTGWVWLGTIVWDNAGGSPTATFVLNRNNVALNR